MRTNTQLANVISCDKCSIECDYYRNGYDYVCKNQDPDLLDNVSNEAKNSKKCHRSRIVLTASFVYIISHPFQLNIHERIQKFKHRRRQQLQSISSNRVHFPLMLGFASPQLLPLQIQLPQRAQSLGRQRIRPKNLWR
jgi:hypothetical protein